MQNTKRTKLSHDDNYPGYLRLLVTQVEAQPAGFGRSASTLGSAEGDGGHHGPLRRSVSEGGPAGHELVVRTLSEETESEVTLLLRDSWTDTRLRPGAYVNLVTVDPSGLVDADGGQAPDWGRSPLWGRPDAAVVVDDGHNLLVLEPDCLVSSTTLAGSFPCPRKALLQERLCQAGTSPQALNGVMAHELFQRALASGDFSEGAVRRTARAVVREHTELLYSVGGTEDRAAEYLEQLTPAVCRWGRQHAAGFGGVVDIEDTVWSPMFGLKGKIDATLKTKTKTETAEAAVVPLEVKSGKRPDLAHRMQVMLYSVLLADRYDQRVGPGLLFYMPLADTRNVQPAWLDVRELVRRRNVLASFAAAPQVGPAAGEAPADLVRRGLPPVLLAPNTCRRCYQRLECMVYHRAFEGGNAASSGVPDVYDEFAGPLTAAQCAYLVEWHSAVEVESRAASRVRSEVWTTAAGAEREAEGSCAGGLWVRPAGTGAGGVALFEFGREQGKAEPLRLVERDSVVASTDGAPPGARRAQYGAVLGVVERAGPSSVTVAIRSGGHASLLRGAGGRVRWRLDRDESGASFRTMKDNVMRLFWPPDRPGADPERRRLVVDLEKPSFAEERALEWHIDRAIGQRAGPAGALGRLRAEAAQLNDDQRRAVERVLAADNYALVLGMPGTGKTSTIVFLVRVLVALGQSVLLTAYTHTAVDNLLLKLRQHGVDFLRVGRPSQVHPDLRDACVTVAPISETTGTDDAAHRVVRTVAELKHAMNACSVVASTCLGVSSPLLSCRRFDVCVVDEASQITQPVCLGPLRTCERFVLVGDHYQLPPLVRDVDARDAGLGVSLFRRLSEAHPSATVSLTYQYRMCREIMSLSSTFVYGHQLRCGSQAVAEARLQVPRWPSHPSVWGDPGLGTPAADWLPGVLDPDRPVLFLDTDRVPAFDSSASGAGEGGAAAAGGSLNVTEAVLVVLIARAFVLGGVKQDDIGVISPYRAQLRLLRSLLDGADPGPGRLDRVEALTVDRFQGRDKACIIVSLVRSNVTGSAGELLQDWRRVNVAVSRARHKLVMVGSRDVVSRPPMLGAMLAHMHRHGWVVPLPESAPALYATGSRLLRDAVASVVGRPACPPARLDDELAGAPEVVEDDEGDAADHEAWGDDV